jgi:hypothetical protein
MFADDANRRESTSIDGGKVEVLHITAEAEVGVVSARAFLLVSEPAVLFALETLLVDEHVTAEIVKNTSLISSRRW